MFFVFGLNCVIFFFICSFPLQIVHVKGVSADNLASLLHFGVSISVEDYGHHVMRGHDKNRNQTSCLGYEAGAKGSEHGRMEFTAISLGLPRILERRRMQVVLMP